MPPSSSKTDQMESVISDLTSVTTCSPATLRLLNDLLKNEEAPAPKFRSKTTTSKTKMSVSPTNSAGLSASERERFATQVTNVILNSLRTATPPALIPQTDVPKDKENQPPRSASVQGPFEPRRPKSLNRMATTIGMKEVKSANFKVNAPATGCMCVIECARVALNVLLGFRPAGDASIETAALTFIGRLLALGLYDEGLADLRAFRKRMDVVLAKATKAAMNSVTKEAGPGDILTFTGADVPTAQRPLVVLAQVHAVRLLSMCKNMSIVEGAVSALRYSESNSPTRIIASLISGNQAKYLRQMEIMTKSILALSPSWSARDDAEAADHGKFPGPVKAFELQCIGLLSAHVVIQHHSQVSEYYQKVIVPLSKVYSALKRRGEMESGAYSMASAYYKMTKEVLEPKMGKWPEPNDPAIMSIHLTLGSLAATAGHFSEAARWIQGVYDLMKPDDNSIRYTSVSAQLLAVLLKEPKLNPIAISILNIVVAGLDGTVKGEMGELEQLTLDINTLRRRALRFIATSKQSADESLVNNLEILCLQFPRFAARWLGKQPTEDATEKEVLRFEQRRQLLVGHADSVVDGCIMVLKRRLDQENQDWSSLNSLLQYCMDFLTRMGDYPSSAQDEGLMSHQYIKISGLYFLYASKTKGIKDKTEQANGLKALRRSIETLNGRPAMEKEKGKYTAKLEKLAESYKHFGHAGEAQLLLHKLCLDLSEGGVLEDVAELLKAKSPSVAWNKHADARILSRALTTLARLGSVDDSWMIALPDLQKAALVEHRIHVVAEYAKDTLDDLRANTEFLMNIYDKEGCYFRHLRALVLLYEHLFARREDIQDLATKIIQSKARLDLDGYGQDEKLAPYLDETWAYFKSIEMLRNPNVDASSFNEAVAGWRSAVSSAMSQSGSLEDVMSNPDALLRHLGAIREFAAMRGDSQVLADVLELSRDICIAMTSSSGNVLLYESMLGTHFLEMGDHSKAASIFLRKRQQLEDEEDGPRDGHVAYYLASANYDIQRGDLDQAKINLDEARCIFEANKSSISMMTRVKFTSEASHLYSVLALNRGDSAQALEYARTAVKIIYQLWSRFEQFKNEDSSSPTTESNEELSSRIQGHGVEFWGLTPPMMRYLQRASAVYMYLGSFADTQYYAEQAYRVASSTGSPRYQAQAACWAASVLVKGNNLADAEKYITIVREYLDSAEPCVNSVSLACQLASMFRSIGKTEDEAQMLELANKHMSEVGAAADDSSEDDIAGKMKGMGLKEEAKEEKTLTRSRSTCAIGPTQSTRTKPTTSSAQATTAASAAKAKATLTRKQSAVSTARKKVDAAASTKKALAAASAAAEVVKPEAPAAATNMVSPMLKTKTSLILSQGLALIGQKDYVGAYEILQEAGEVILETTSSMERNVACAMCLIGRALEKMIRDPVFSVVQDSTLSFPAVCNGKSEVSKDDSDIDMADIDPIKARPKAKPRSRTKAVTAGPTFVDDLREAKELLVKANSVASVCGDAGLVYRVSSLLQTALIFLSATTIDNNVVDHPAYASSTVEYARNLVWRRERDASTCSFSLLTEWPPVFDESSSRSTDTVEGYGDINRFQQDYVDILPAEWSAISLVLSDNKSDLCITKLQTGHTPFVLRLPLERATSREIDVDVFNFAQGHAELIEIVNQSNESCHSAKKMTDRESRLQWRKHREDIDQRLEALLGSIEHLWLGGFRGIFSQHCRRTDLLAQFQQNFQNTLDKHLPSRRKVRNRKESKKITLDPRILDLFIGLGDPSDHEDTESQQYDIDEALTDLLYFVVDILQFHGERNAYDEIDFDAMIIETMDALTAYHHAAGTKRRLDIPKNAHTILILDKELIPFPWESLPCMEAQAVSRVPSLDYLRRAIIDQENAREVRPKTSVPSGHIVSHGSGTYMLNPGGDLSNTQARFEGAMQALPNTWKSIVTTTPTEQVFEEALATRDILVYMGHGSGAQYIRSKTVRKMKKLRATALLIGCSSAKLTPAGAFEHYGTPRNYLLAGCPAVVGMLWDVTDREIDRYAAGLMEDWGMLPTGTFKEDFFTDSHRPAARRKYRERNFMKGKMSLVEAVVEARARCTFRYLTAAAVVVYGIPVYIGE